MLRLIGLILTVIGALNLAFGSKPEWIGAMLFLLGIIGVAAGRLLDE